MKNSRKSMRVTAVYASVDAETKGDINTEAAMSGYKCGSCGQGTIALSAPEGGGRFPFLHALWFVRAAHEGRDQRQGGPAAHVGR